MQKIKKKWGLNKKGNSLRSMTLLIIFVILLMTTVFLWLGDGTSYYGKTISSGYSSNFNEINDSMTDMRDKSKDFNKQIDKIKESPGTSLFFIPGVILDAIKLSFTYISVAWTIFNQYNTILGIPLWIMLSLEAAFLFYLGYLILDAYLRNKRT